MKKLAVALSVFSLLALGASPALARGGGWQPLGLPGARAVRNCPGTTDVLHIVFTTGKEYYRVVTQHGVDYLQVTGAFKFDATNQQTGQTRHYNSSGPTHVPIELANIDFVATGLNSLFFSTEQVEQWGLPVAFITSGPIDISFGPNGEITAVQITNIKDDICAELT